MKPIKIDESAMYQDLARMSVTEFQEKYLVTPTEYNMLIKSHGEASNVLLKAMQDHTEVIERLAAVDAAQDESLKRPCPFKPFYNHGAAGRVVVTRDQPVLRPEQSRLALPRRLRTQKEVLPTTGHIIDVASTSQSIHDDLINKRIIFGPMSGTTICFSGYPTFYILEIAEILGIIVDDKAKVIEQEIEPLT